MTVSGGINLILNNILITNNNQYNTEQQYRIDNRQQIIQQQITREEMSDLNIPTLFPPAQLKSIKTSISHLKQTLTLLIEISNTNKEAVSNYISQQVRHKQESEDPDQQYTLLDDLKEMQHYIRQAEEKVAEVKGIEEGIRNRIEEMVGAENGRGEEREEVRERMEGMEKEIERLKLVEKEVEKYKEQITLLGVTRAETDKEMIRLRQQQTLLTQKLQGLQLQSSTLTTKVQQQSQRIQTLQQQKKLSLKVSPQNTPAPSDLQKRLQHQTIKSQQKDREIQELKKKISEDKVTIFNLADELKTNSLKTQKTLEKYEASKVEVKSFRDKKKEEIDQLRKESEEGNRRVRELEERGRELEGEIKEKNREISEIRSRHEKMVNSVEHRVNLEQEFESLSNELQQAHKLLEEKQSCIKDLQATLARFKEKRESLLKIVQNPAKHEIDGLVRIHDRLEGMYKEYVVDVFEKGNVVGFQRRIKDVMIDITELVDELSDSNQ